VNLGPLGAAEAWITANKTSPRPVWLTAEEEAKHKDILSKGYTGPLNWYMSLSAVLRRR
jgi:soluble epoxide hydrolase/lipid-phosphate phosphatase